MKMLFHRRQSQAGVISNLLITPPFADKPGNFLFAARKLSQMRQMRARRPRVRSDLTAQIFALDKEMRSRHAD